MVFFKKKTIFFTSTVIFTGSDLIILLVDTKTQKQTYLYRPWIYSILEIFNNIANKNDWFTIQILAALINTVSRHKLAAKFYIGPS